MEQGCDNKLTATNQFDEHPGADVMVRTRAESYPIYYLPASIQN